MYRSCVIYGFRENNKKILDWDFVHKHGLEIFFEQSETFHASRPYYGIKTDINSSSGYIRRGKALKDTVDEFYKLVNDFCVSENLSLSMGSISLDDSEKVGHLYVPSIPEFVCVLWGDLHYNLEVYSPENIQFKSTIYLEYSSEMSREELIVRVQQLISDITETNSVSEIYEIKDPFVSNSICFKHTFYSERESALNFIAKLMSLESMGSEIKQLEGIRIHNYHNRAQIGNVWLHENTIMDMV
jgi:hypothetical protein